VTLQTEGLQTLEQIRAFLEGSQPMGFEIPSREAANDLIAQTLRRFGCARLGKADKGLVRRYLCKVTGRSRAQMTRLIAQFRRTGRIKDRRGAPARPFPRRYTRGRMSCCWPRSTTSTAPSRAPLPESSVGAPTRASAISAMHASPGSPTATSTTSDSAKPTLGRSADEW